MSQSNQIKSDKLLLVEGKDEKEFCMNFFEYLQIPDSSFQIIDVGGKDQFKIKIPPLTLASNFSNVKKIGIVRDADDNVKDTFKSIKHTLKNNGLAVPKVLNQIMHEKDKASVIVYIQPNNVDPGAIEDICLDSIANEPVMDCVNSFFDCVDINGMSETSLSKRKIQVYLSTLTPKFWHSIGLSAKAGQWDYSHTSFLQYEQFLINFVS